MISNKLIALYVNALTVEDGIAMAKKYDVNFTYEEGKVILPFLKQHKNELCKENIELLLLKIKKVVAPTTLSKIKKLLDSIL